MTFCDFDVYVGRSVDGVSMETGLGDRAVTLLMEPDIPGVLRQLFPHVTSSVISSPGGPTSVERQGPVGVDTLIL